MEDYEIEFDHTPGDETVAIMLADIGHSDTETSHIEADKLLCKLLVTLGYQKSVAAFMALPKWYA